MSSAAAGVLAMAGAGIACAQETGTSAGAAQGNIELNTITVQSGRPSDRLDLDSQGKPAVLTTTTDRDELDHKQVQSIEDYGRLVDAGVNFNSSNNSVNILGLDENRVLTTIDSIQVPWLNDGARGVEGGINSFDFDSLSRLDVLKANDSSFFGTGSLGGVLALRTLDPEDLLQNGKSVGGITKLTADSADDSWSVHQALAAKSGNTYVLFQGGYKQGHEVDNEGRIGGTGATRTRVNPADYDQGNFLVKLHQYLGEGSVFGLTGEVFTRDKDEKTLTSAGTTYRDYTTEEIRKRKRVSATYDYKGAEGDAAIDEAHLLAYFQRVNLQTNTAAYRLTAPIGEYDRDSDLEENSYGLKGSLTKNFATGPATHAFTLGGEVIRTETEQYAAGRDNCTARIYSCSFLHVNQSDMPDVDGTAVGLFAQDRIGFFDDRVRITPGLRFDWYRDEPQDTASYAANAAYEGLPGKSSDSRLSPKLLAEWDVAPTATLFAQWSQGFRAPSATELYLTYGGSGTYVSIGNPDLKPETSNGYVLGAKLGDDRMGGRISVFNNYYSNFIDTITTTADAAGLSGSYPYGVYEYINRAHVQIYGGQVDAHWQFRPHWRAWTSVAYSVGRDTDEDIHLNSIPPLKGILGLGYADDTWGADLSMTAATARNKVEDDTSDFNKTQGYAVFDLNGWWEPKQVKGLRLAAGVFNILDKKYYNAVALPDSTTQAKEYFTSPGRTFRGSAIYRF
ncbi:TonB-dependent hemoglobin/transferrin/lactoferrin family receptor [Faunimonas pinastri]|uniref:TonB-dependent hemoglobin/transferrin/lactoferrin family receptor n=1 Tax=Faunimonas pinastri TaxID=1855383 RepID=UPI0015A57F4F|nr:TonB-dependent hemoglobin/transferrin/lactoferrin family receptor [Faunimonas pinastri]